MASRMDLLGLLNFEAQLERNPAPDSLGPVRRAILERYRALMPNTGFPKCV